jgi:hypothetical protein
MNRPGEIACYAGNRYIDARLEYRRPIRLEEEFPLAMADVIKLAELPAKEVPEKLRWEYYFDFQAHPFAHASVVTEATSVIDVLGRIGPYARSWLAEKIDEMSRSDSVRLLTEEDFPGRGTGAFRAVVAEGAVFDPAYFVGSPAGERPGTVCLGPRARLLGAVVYPSDGDVYVGAKTVIEPGVGIKGPAIIMEANEVRQGAYLRGNVILGSASGDTAFRGELKNVLVMNDANFPHPSYLGDSLAGYGTHFGDQVTAANHGIFQGLRDPRNRTNIVIHVDGAAYDLGLVKMGCVLGDRTQIGCSTLLAPGTLIGPGSVAYGLSNIDRGVYGRATLFKNKSHGGQVIETGGVDIERL